jgi:hypothetical protein
VLTGAVRVTDGSGAATAASQTVTVAPPPLQWLQPFPVVRIRGRTTERGARVTLLGVQAPAGSTVAGRCRGRGCSRTPHPPRVGQSGSLVRLRAFECHMRAGVRLEVFVMKPGVVGKYTRFRIRRLEAPRRPDRCLMPDSLQPVGCPA